MDFVLSLAEWLELNPQLSGPIFVLAFALIMAVGIPGGNFLMLFGGYLFGWWMGAVLATLGGALAALATHALIRTAFGRWLDERAGNSHRWVRDFVERGNALLLVLPRLIMVIPFFVLNVGFTAAGIPLRTYLWTTAAGLLPIAMLVSSIGAELRDLDEISGTSVLALLASPGLYLPLALLFGLTVLGWVLIRRRGAD